MKALLLAGAIVGAFAGAAYAQTAADSAALARAVAEAVTTGNNALIPAKPLPPPVPSAWESRLVELLTNASLPQAAELADGNVAWVELAGSEVRELGSANAIVRVQGSWCLGASGSLTSPTLSGQAREYHFERSGSAWTLRHQRTVLSGEGPCDVAGPKPRVPTSPSSG